MYRKLINPFKDKYKRGTKLVEVEGEETVFEKDSRGKFKKVADFKGGKSHAEGGEPYIATEGEVIFPKKDRKKVLEAYKNKDHQKLEKLRKKLPEDNPNKKTERAATGMDFTSLLGSQGSSTGFSALESLPSFFNVGKGLFGKVEREQKQTYNPELLEYRDSSDPLRRAVESMRTSEDTQARNLSGGSASNLRINQIMNNTRFLDRIMQIDNQEVQRQNQIRNQNTELKNQSQLINNQESIRVNQANSQNRAKKDEFLAKGLEGFAGLASRDKQAQGMKERDSMLEEYMFSDQYLDPQEALKAKNKFGSVQSIQTNTSLPIKQTNTVSPTLSEADLINLRFKGKVFKKGTKKVKTEGKS